jgi:hypothetical protein
MSNAKPVRRAPPSSIVFGAEQSTASITCALPGVGCPAWCQGISQGKQSSGTARVRSTRPKAVPAAAGGFTAQGCERGSSLMTRFLGIAEHRGARWRKIRARTT